MFKNTLAVAGAAILSLFNVTSGLAQVANPQTHYNTISTSTIVSIMTEMDLNTQIIQLDDGSELVAVPLEGGPTILVGVDGCTQGPAAGCVAMGMMIVAPVAALPGQNLGQDLSILNQFNTLIDSTKFVLPENKFLAAVRYETYIHGASRGNMAADFSVMVLETLVFFQSLTQLRSQMTTLSSQSHDLNKDHTYNLPFSLVPLSKLQGPASLTKLIPHAGSEAETGLDQYVEKVIPLFHAKSFREDFLWVSDAE